MNEDAIEEFRKLKEGQATGRWHIVLQDAVMELHTRLKAVENGMGRLMDAIQQEQAAIEKHAPKTHRAAATLVMQGITDDDGR